MTIPKLLFCTWNVYQVHLLIVINQLMLSVYNCPKVITLSGVYCTKPFLLTLPKDNTKQSILTWKKLIETWQKNDWFSWTKYIIFPKKEIVLKQKNILLTSITEELVNATGRRFKHKLIFLSSTKKIAFEVSKKALNVSNKRGS
jgi:hypothetical protein